MHERLKISHYKHSGRLLPHEYTSYAPLALLVLIVGVILAGFSASVFANNQPQSGSIGLTGTVPATPPKIAATILTPANNSHTAISPIKVSGTCPAGDLVEIYKNDIFAGSGPCQNNGTYSFEIDLLYGENSLIARVYDSLNQAGPDSNVTNVFYDAVPAQSAPLSFLSFGSAQMILNTNAVYRGTFPNQPLNIPISIIGGTPPYAINILWGDSSNNVISRSDNLAFNASHAYKQAGIFEVSIQASDSQGHAAFLNVAVIVNGQPSVITGTTAPKKPTNELLVLWPVYAIAATTVVSFWLGEQREKRILRSVINQ